jgi:CYTH domain-containing protein
MSIPGSTDRFEIQQRISEREYYIYIEERADHNYRPIRKIRYCFLWNNQYFEVDRFLDETDDYQLEWEGTDRNHILQFPSFIKVIKEVTEEKKYGNKERAKIR